MRRLSQALRCVESTKLIPLMGDAYRYGVAFLSETGYFDSKNRFWTNQNFPEAKAVHDKIKAKILSIGLNESGLQDAYETLNGKSF